MKEWENERLGIVTAWEKWKNGKNERIRAMKELEKWKNGKNEGMGKRDGMGMSKFEKMKEWLKWENVKK